MESTKRSWLSALRSRFALSEARELRVAQVGHEHGARRVRDAQLRPRDLDGHLGRDAARPKDRQLMGMDDDRIAEVWLLELRNADQGRVTQVHGRTVNGRKARSHLNRPDSIGSTQRT